MGPGDGEAVDEMSREMFSPEAIDPTVELLAELAGTGQALEFAIGTGRVALPLAAQGVPVSGIELSTPMVDQLRKKPGGAALTVVVGDMATSSVPGQFSLVFLVWNGISNLRTQDEQVECFLNAARHLKPGGRFVVELWVPDSDDSRKARAWLSAPPARTTSSSMSSTSSTRVASRTTTTTTRTHRDI